MFFEAAFLFTAHYCTIQVWLFDLKAWFHCRVWIFGLHSVGVSFTTKKQDFILLIFMNIFVGNLGPKKERKSSLLYSSMQQQYYSCISGSDV